ncbi:GGDEF domain-containing protein [Neorhizobium lilium]|uniref:GGDEF domain-containing protein n=1 Tax=Neorhizobium lilium TaxID=2503024 RepID=A0A3S3VJF4_9HYPH|nr:GGDEF domain-containing protein [Neorhizobium lilium]RWX75858.1 GGDEF domain-containing protein [Neorhizobium lilium]
MSIQTRKPAQDRMLQTVSQHMARLEVGGLPRNYELFYEAHCGADPGLRREVLALPVLPPQQQLDEIGTRYQLPGFVAPALPPSRENDIRLLSSLRDQMVSGVEQKKGFTRVLEAVARSLREDSNAGPQDILAEIEYLSVSLSDAVVAETELEAALRTGANQLVKAERDASVARAVLLRDRLTGLPNHAAFVERLEMLYSSDNEYHETALFLVAISDIGELADTYGEATANRILKKAASIFRKTIKKNDFLARIGKGEFAFLFRDVNRDSTRSIAERLSVAIADNLVFATSDGSAGVDLLIGAALRADAISPQQLRHQAVTAAETIRSNTRMTVVLSGNSSRS